MILFLNKGVLFTGKTAFQEENFLILSYFALENCIFGIFFSTNVLKTLTTIFSNVHELFCFAVPHDGESFYTKFHELS
ncbi:hypothetical protein C7Y71_006265 [Pseudoprevotella muciniphila]|uniref:Uncharacterized protein n=1 Tax=Pseudoprevotella muciniphila TaxID=2133944 RepID=A0A5P8E6P5_9BACT|nr:hypothetical protein C7Y71_006265 [Pseudoprevotella muciniphila]